MCHTVIAKYDETIKASMQFAAIDSFTRLVVLLMKFADKAMGM